MLVYCVIFGSIVLSLFVLLVFFVVVFRLIGLGGFLGVIVCNDNFLLVIVFLYLE